LELLADMNGFMANEFGEDRIIFQVRPDDNEWPERERHCAVSETDDSAEEASKPFREEDEVGAFELHSRFIVPYVSGSIRIRFSLPMLGVHLYDDSRQ